MMSCALGMTGDNRYIACGDGLTGRVRRCLGRQNWKEGNLSLKRLAMSEMILRLIS